MTLNNALFTVLDITISISDGSAGFCNAAGIMTGLATAGADFGGGAPSSILGSVSLVCALDAAENGGNGGG